MPSNEEHLRFENAHLREEVINPLPLTKYDCLLHQLILFLVIYGPLYKFFLICLSFFIKRSLGQSTLWGLIKGMISMLKDHPNMVKHENSY